MFFKYLSQRRTQMCYSAETLCVTLVLSSLISQKTASSWENSRSPGYHPTQQESDYVKTLTIPPRSEAVLLVKSSTKNSLLPGDYEPKIFPKIRGLYAIRSRVIPNIDGVFQITDLNVNSSDITLKSRTSMVFIQPADEIVMSVAPDENLTSTLADIKISDRLSRDEKSEVTRLIKEYQDIFAANLKNQNKQYC